MNIRDAIKNGLLFDGATGTYIQKRLKETVPFFEALNAENPALIKDIHEEYLESGAAAIKTNTFSLNRVCCAQNAEALIKAGCDIAKDAAGAAGAFVFASIGPVPNLNGDVNISEELIWTADRFIENEVYNFLFETQSQLEGLAECARSIKEKVPESYIIAGFAADEDGYTRDGLYAGDILNWAAKCEYIDAAGFNCVSSARSMLSMLEGLELKPFFESGHELSVMPNAGYPVVLGNRTFYEGDPAYYAAQLAKIKELGANILGGCCGTTPAHIKEAAKALFAFRGGKGGKKTAAESIRIIPPGSFEKISEKKQEASSSDFQSSFMKRLKSSEKAVAVELDPPKDASSEKFMAGARELKDAGADIITVADCPIGRARIDSSLLACKIQREAHIEAIPHLTCRDRNIIATKALLMGLCAEGVRNVLCVTGDPVPSSERDIVKSVYQFNSRKLASFIASLNDNALPHPFNIFTAINVNAKNFDIQLRLAKEKLLNGSKGFFTQPVLSEKAFENLKRARKELDCFLLGGIMPVVSERNARYMDCEVNGINVEPDIIKMYAGLDREQGEALAVKISNEIIKNISPYVDGYYLITPFGRTGLMSRIIAGIQ